MYGSGKVPRPPWPDAQWPKRGHGRSGRVAAAGQAVECSVRAVSNASADTDGTDVALDLVDVFSRGSKNHHKGQCMPCRSNGSGNQCPRGATCDCCHYFHGPEKFKDMRRFAALAKQRKHRDSDPARVVPNAPDVDEAPRPPPKTPPQQEELALESAPTQPTRGEPALASAPAQPTPRQAPPIGLPLRHRALEDLTQHELESPRADSTAASTPPPSPYTTSGPATLPSNTCVPSHISPEQLAVLLQKAAPDYYDD